jgi:RimK family alpha-L-glutamate ligase
MRGWILYFKKTSELSKEDYGVQRLLEEAKNKKLSLEVYKPEQFELIVANCDNKSVFIDGKKQLIPDFIIPRMGSSTTYFGLAIIRHLENLGVYCCNRSKTIEMVKDKLHVHQVLAESKLPTPKTMLVKYPADPKFIKREIGFPSVIKNIYGTEGKGIHLCKTEEEFVDIMELIFAHNKSPNIILQEYIKISKGKDLRIFLVGGKPVATMIRSAKKGFKANYTRGGNVAPFELTRELEWLATEVARLMELDVAGIDILFNGQNTYKICEGNSSPGFKGLEEATGKNIAAAILDFIIEKVVAKQEAGEY